VRTRRDGGGWGRNLTAILCADPHRQHFPARKTSDQGICANVNCGATFNRQRTRRTYCPKCRPPLRLQPLADQHCAWCQAVLTGGRQRTCVDCPPDLTRPHGTKTAYNWHNRAGIPPCEPCAERARQDARKSYAAHRDTKRKHYLRNRESKGFQGNHGGRYERVCQVCQTPFIAGSSRAKYCSDACRPVYELVRGKWCPAPVVRRSWALVDWKDGLEPDLTWVEFRVPPHGGILVLCPTCGDYMTIIDHDQDIRECHQCHVIVRRIAMLVNADGVLSPVAA
jgi:hypothetical protein